jgi:CheY-like chemotaxis protein
MSTGGIQWGRASSPMHPEGRASDRLTPTGSGGDMHPRFRYFGRRRALVADTRSAMLLAQLSHDIRAPLAAIRVLLTGIRQGGGQHSLVDEVEQSVQYLLNLSESYLHMVRADTLDAHVAEGEFDLTPVLLDAVNLVKRRLADKPLRLIVDWRSADLRVQGQALPIQQILVNLLSNAIKFTPSGHVHVAVQVPPSRPTGAALTLVVTDTGPGLQDQATARAFEPFVQLHGQDAVNPHGFGLGLAIVKSLAEMLGGGVVATDMPEGGLRVSATLKMDWAHAAPVCTPHPALVRACWVLDAHEQAGQALAQGLQALGVRSARCLSGFEFSSRLQGLQPGDLVVCDASFRPAAAAWLASLVLRVKPGVGFVLLSDAPAPAEPDGVVRVARIGVPARVLAHLLPPQAELQRASTLDHGLAPLLPARHRGKRVLVVDDSRVNQIVVGDYLSMLGFGVQTADHGHEALELLAREDVDLVLTDLDMPVMGGAGLLQAVRVRGQKVPVVVLSGSAEPDVRTACLDAGMAGYLIKPLDFERALGTLVAVLDATAVTA